MFEILRYNFFQNALIGALLVSICCGMIGTYVVTRRLVFISGGITHASFGGLGLGFFLGMNPIFTALIFSIMSAFGVEWMSKKYQVREDSAIAVFWSFGMAVGIIFIFLTPGYTPGLSEFLFGNILTITSTDIIMFSSFTTILLMFFILFLNQIIFVAFDSEFARTQNQPVRFIEYMMMLFIAISIVMTIRLIGIVLLMSLLTIPQIIANIFTYNFKHMVVFSTIISIICCIFGLMVSYFVNIPSGACIIFIMVIVYVLSKAVFFLLKKQTYD